jgi:hypothetical protein
MCSELFQELVCRITYAPCDALTTAIMPICASFCNELLPCLAASPCASALAGILDCSSANGVQFVAPDAGGQCAPAFALDTTPSPTPPSSFDIYCTDVNTLGHACARDNYLKLNGSGGDAYFQRVQTAFRLMPHNSDPADADEPWLYFFMTELDAVSVSPVDGDVVYTNDPLRVSWLAFADITCNYTDTLQTLTYTYALPNAGSAHVAEFSIATYDRVTTIDATHTHVTRAGALRWEFSITGDPFNNSWPDGANAIAGNLNMYMKELPFNISRTNVDGNTTQLFAANLVGAQFSINVSVRNGDGPCV